MALEGGEIVHCYPPSPGSRPKIPWEGTPMRSTKRESSYCSRVIERNPQGSSRSRSGSRGLELKRVFEVAPHSPSHRASSERATSLPRQLMRECDGVRSITVHASDFLKYKGNLAMLQACKIEPLEREMEKMQVEKKPEPWVAHDPWKGMENPILRREPDYAHMNAVWFPPSPKKEENESQASTRSGSPMSAASREATELPNFMRNTRSGSRSRQHRPPLDQDRKRLVSRQPSARSASKESTCDSVASSSSSDGRRTPRSARGQSLPPVNLSQSRRAPSCGSARGNPKQFPRHSSRSPRENEIMSSRSVDEGVDIAMESTVGDLHLYLKAKTPYPDVSQDSHQEVDAVAPRASSRGRPPRPVSAAKPGRWR